MKKYYPGLTCILLFLSLTIISWKAETIKKNFNTNPVKTHKAANSKELLSQYLDDIYNTAQLQQAGLDFVVFQKAVIGYFNLKAGNQVPQTSAVITIVDLAKSSASKRMWIIDLIDKSLLMQTWVAHGNGSGDDIPQYFSNFSDSHASSLGFYITNGVYNGKHGESLKLDGLDVGFNDNARARGIVIHGAKYVSPGTIDHLGRLGRSEGCPAVSAKLIKKVIGAIKGKTVMFINGNDYTYSSKYLDEDAAANYVYPGQSSASVNASL